MELYCSVSSSLPAITNVIMGCCRNQNYYLDLSLTTEANQQIVNDFVNIIDKHVSVTITNYPENYQFDTSIIVSTDDTDLEVITLDYTSLANDQKQKVTDYLELVNTLITQ